MRRFDPVTWVKVLRDLPERTPGNVRFDDDEIALLMGDAAARVLHLWPPARYRDLMTLRVPPPRSAAP